MIKRAWQLRWRRRVKRSQQQVENIGSQAEQNLDKHLFKRLNRFVGVRRFVFSWVMLFLLIAAGIVVQLRALSPFYQSLEPGRGGILTEGVVGSFTNANPIYATGSVDASVSRLVFSSLMKYDNDNNLVGDLAKEVKVDDRGLVYTVKLRQNAKWHDGQPVSAKDVAFTYKTIKKADAKSPLFANWQKVEVAAQGDDTVIFTLPHGLASFQHSLTNGIVPEHLLKHIPAAELRSASFNTVKPIGSGPFKWDAIKVVGDTQENREEQVGLTANTDYYQGPPKLERFVIRGFHSEDKLREAFENGDVNTAAGLSEAPNEVQQSLVAREFSVPLTGEVMIFLKNSHEILKDTKMRQALSRGTNQTEVVKELGYPVALAKGPLLPSHNGYDRTLPQLGYNPTKARALLEKAGWKTGPNGIRIKKGKPLTFELTSQSNSQYSVVAQAIQKQWRELGVDLKVTLLSDNELQTTIASHGYDALLYGITLGSDPDVYAYWHSSQADPRAESRLNLSEYKSNAVDLSLEVGRGRLNDKSRAQKYRAFLRTWRNDAPAIALYQPRYLYLTNNNLYGFEPTVFNGSTDRYANVENWAVLQDRVDIY